ncbi:hypothetical protein PVL29_002303 [Vitis rotundifolia]|uniref:4-hydroxyphenylpyruvate dioxygenase n=1 Tax=Vitis rotundifolia TaxID=103349 RepID=A0AA39AGU4_VITRO|nr:hypothetical protein PVL29_002303 [Vitis rotundifolia]
MSPLVTIGGFFVISEVHLYGWTKNCCFPWTWGSGGWTTPWVTSGAGGRVLEAIKWFHELAEFMVEDGGTSESRLNSVVLACNNEIVLLLLNEPVFGIKRKNQIQTYLEHNEGAGMQHLVLMSDNICRTLREIRQRSGVGRFEFMPSPPSTYYRNMKKKAGDVPTNDQIKECEDLGILVNKNNQGTLLQIFTKPLGDRKELILLEYCWINWFCLYLLCKPTIFIEIIQRLECMVKDCWALSYKGGCGGFGKDNFSKLLISIEEYENTLEAKRIAKPAPV